MSAVASVEALLGGAHVGEMAYARGAPPVPAAFPRSADELAELLTLAARERLVLLPAGLGSELAELRPPERVDLIVSTRALAGVVAYEPGDGTLTALAGTRWSELREVARAGGHWLTPDVARPARATLGGVLAAGRSGFDRLRYGPVRHHVLGTRVALANAEVTKSGGRLVKNVTGYDLHRLHCGAHGTLGVIVEASLRLFPLPQRTAVIAADFDALAPALSAARAIAASDARPTAIALSAPASGAFELLVRLDGRAAGVERERALVERLLAAPRALEEDEARRASDAWREREPDPGAGAALRVACRPSELEAVAMQSLARARSRGATADAVLHPALATLELALQGLDGEQQVALVRELRAALAPHRARVALRGGDWSTPSDLDPIAEPGPALALMRRLRDALDPDGRFARGRFHGGL